jgi:hypothetical protein
MVIAAYKNYCSESPAEYFPDCIKVESWVATYQNGTIPPIDLEEVKRVYREGRMLSAELDSNDSDDSALSKPPLDDCTAAATEDKAGQGQCGVIPKAGLWWFATHSGQGTTMMQYMQRCCSTGEYL